MCNFSTDDVLKIARAVIEDAVLYMDGDHTPYFYCEYCDGTLVGYHVQEKDFNHNVDCPVLVAQDVLTGYGGEHLNDADPEKSASNLIKALDIIEKL